MVDFSSPVSCLLLHPTVLLPALPDVHLRVQREVQVQPLCYFRLGTVATSDHETPLTIYEQFRVTGTDSSVENYTDLFTIALRNDDIQEFDSKWDGILLSMTKIPPDDILEGLYKLRIRESEKLKTVLELYDLETHQKKLGPDYHR